MHKTWYSIIAISLLWILGRTQTLEVWNEQTTVQEVLHELGEPYPPHYIAPDPELVKQGEELVKIGRTRNKDGKKQGTSANIMSVQLAIILNRKILICASAILKLDCHMSSKKEFRFSKVLPSKESLIGRAGIMMIM